MTYNAFKITLFLNGLYRFLDNFDTIGVAEISQGSSRPTGRRLKPWFGNG
jgi:hypothetical protein